MTSRGSSLHTNGNQMIRPVETKSLPEVVAEWDALAPLRYRQISSGEDISYTKVIGPTILNLVSGLKAGRILDAGCGVGILSQQLSEFAKEIVGVDPSGNSIEIAKETNKNEVRFFTDTIERFSLNAGVLFDVIVANMVLMDVLDLSGFLESCSRLVCKRGYLIFSITHPCFWPMYYGYGNKPWFKYNEQQIIEAPFRISADRIGSLPSTHTHRPLSAYITALTCANFVIETIQEPMPPRDLNERYLSRWKLPRYLAARCVYREPSMS
jgi:2-polyprenyl-3-methyl-5-hydroxy-6-metoxy-1,4-benzoquinol methylase